MGCSERRDIEIPDCKESNPNDCHRTYHLYLPNILCDDDDNDNDDNGSNHHRRGLQHTTGDATPGRNDEREEISAVPASSSYTTYTPIEEDINIGTLPLVFAVHCVGCNAESVKTFVPHAHNANVVLVIPEGIQHSFNARHCCGYALQNEVDDVGFFKYIQSTLSEEYSFVDSDYSYAVGWSNGGFFVMHAASLFRSISPISGFQYDIDPSVTKSGTFCVDGICVDAPGAGKGIFLHHGSKDEFVRPTGCCADPNMPGCCCGISAETCVSTMEVAKNWALEVNGCELEEENGSSSRSTLEEIIEGDEADEKGGSEDKGGEEEEEEEAKDAEESDSTGEQDDEGEDDKKKEATTTIAPGAKFTSSYTDPNRGIECYTTTGTDCKANSTICLHRNSDHFNRPSFDQAFPMAKEVIDFFARDACEIRDGKWDDDEAHDDACTCPEDRGGTFCLDDPVAVVAESNISPVNNADDDFFDKEMVSSKVSSWKIGYFFFPLMVYCAARYRWKRGKKKVDGFSNDVVSDEEATELVSSQRFR